MFPALAITTGEPAGIGPELSVQLAQKQWPAKLLFIGDPELLSHTAKNLSLELNIQQWQEGSIIPEHEAGKIICLPVTLKNKSEPGKLDSSNSKYVLQTLKLANDLCLNTTIQGIVTGPIHKGVINDANIPFSGHTEFFAYHSNTPKVVMLLATTGMRVALVTTHLPLAKVSQAVTHKAVEETIRIVNNELQSKFCIKNPKLLVLGLNPHAGEGGYMGTEEIEVLEPVIQKLLQEGFDIQGPVSADTAFGSHQHPATVDAIIAMYHDQGLPVLKYRGFGHAINITLGLPYIRTSVDHGTALDLAGKGIASPVSFEYALNEAITMGRKQETT